jgi:methionyl-tRNA formyltransferase
VTETGVTIMQMDVGLDTGDMLYKLSCQLPPKTPVRHFTISWHNLAAGLLATLTHLQPVRQHQGAGRSAGYLCRKTQQRRSAS